MSASTPSTTSQDDFAARLDRIRAKAGQHVLMVGQDEQVLIPRKERHQTTRSQEVAGNARYPASLVGAAFLGMAAVVAGHYARFQMMTTMTALQDPANEIVFVVVIGIALSFVLSQAFRLTSKLHRSLQGVGVFVMACMFHNRPNGSPRPMHPRPRTHSALARPTIPCSPNRLFPPKPMPPHRPGRNRQPARRRCPSGWFWMARRARPRPSIRPRPGRRIADARSCPKVNLR